MTGEPGFTTPKGSFTKRTVKTKQKIPRRSRPGAVSIS
jgi:hypothetical protein